MSENNRSAGSTPVGRSLSIGLRRRSADSQTRRCQQDLQRLTAELNELGKDIQDGDFAQARERLFFLTSHLVLDPAIYADDEELYRTAVKVQEERHPFQVPVCRSHLHFIERWIRTLRSAFQARWRGSHEQWTPEFEGFVQQQLRVVAEALHSTEQDNRLLAVRELMRLVQESDALEFLRQARQTLERYRSYLVSKQEASRANQAQATNAAAPDWQRQIDEDFAVNRYYAQKVQEIKRDRTLTKEVKGQMLEKVNQLWEQTHFDMMQPPEQGVDECEPFHDEECDGDQQPLPDNVRLLQTGGAFAR